MLLRMNNSTKSVEENCPGKIYTINFKRKKQKIVINEVVTFLSYSRIKIFASG